MILLNSLMDSSKIPKADMTFTVNGYIDVGEDILMVETHVMTDAEIIA